MTTKPHCRPEHGLKLTLSCLQVFSQFITSTVAPTMKPPKPDVTHRDLPKHTIRGALRSLPWYLEASPVPLGMLWSFLFLYSVYGATGS